MIIKWFKIKAMEIEMKYTIYSAIAELAKEQENIIKLVKDLYTSLKDVPVDDLRKELISNIATLAHEEAIKLRENKSA